MERFSIREIIEQAIQTEKLGNEFYTKMAEKFHDDKELTETVLLH
jgi:rubrerythrin